MAYALDSSIVIDLVNGEAAVIDMLESAIKNGFQISIPLVAHYEVVRGFCHTKSTRRETAYGKLCMYCPVGKLTTSTWDNAAFIWAKLRKAGHTIGDADILIAAYCIENRYTLVTHNTKHFKHIKGLYLVDWAKKLKE